MSISPKDLGKKFSLDKGLFLILLLISALSVFAIYCAEPIMSASLRESNLWATQILWYVLGSALCIFLTRFGMDRFFTGIKVFYWLLLLALALLLVDKMIIDLPFIRPVNGTTAWYQIPYVGSIQPSEFMKVVLIIMCANIISEHNEWKQEISFSSDLSLFWKIAKITAPPILLIIAQPDTGIPIIICVSILIMLCISGIRKEWFIFGSIAVAFMIGGIVILYEINPETLNQLFGGYRLTRFYAWLDPELYSLSWGNQLYTSLLTLGSSGLDGLAYREAIIYFPEPQTDFIFTVIGQNAGFIGTLTTALLCLVLDLKLLWIAIHHDDERKRLLVAGVVGMLIYQQFQNMGMVVGILPITGITLPFISYGGSSMISYMIPLAIIFTMASDNKLRRYGLAT